MKGRTCLAWAPGNLSGRGGVPAGRGLHTEVQRQPTPDWVGIYFSDRELPMVALRLLVRGGSWEDPSGHEGLAHLTAQLLLEGTSRRRANEIHEAVEAMGGALYVECARDYTVLGLHIVKQRLDEGMALLTEMLREPSFPLEELEKKRDRIKGEIASQEDRPGGVAQRAFGEVLFGGRTGYGHEPRGFADTLDVLGLDEVAAHYNRAFRGRQIIAVAAGDIDPTACADRFSRLLMGWEGAGNGLEKGVSAPGGAPQATRRVTINRPVSQATVILGQGGVPRGHPDVHGLQVMNYILGGGGFDSRLLEEIRSKRGLAYSAYSYLEPLLHGGIFRVAFQTKNASVSEATGLAVQVALGMQQSLVAEAELEGAKRYLLGSFPMRLDSNAGVASSLALWECYGLGVDYPAKFAAAIARVDRQEVRRVAREHLQPKDWTQVVVGNEDEILRAAP